MKVIFGSFQALEIKNIQKYLFEFRKNSIILCLIPFMLLCIYVCVLCVLSLSELN